MILQIICIVLSIVKDLPFRLIPMLLLLFVVVDFVIFIVVVYELQEYIFNPTENENTKVNRLIF